MKSFAIVLASLAVASAGASYSTSASPSYSTSAEASSTSPCTTSATAYSYTTAPAATTTMTYSVSCPGSSADETVTRSAVSTPCPSCPVYTVSYSSGMQTPGMPTATVAQGAAGKVDFPVALGLVAFVAALF